MPLMPGAEPFRHEGGRTSARCCATASPARRRRCAPGREHLADAGLTVAAAAAARPRHDRGGGEPHPLGGLVRRGRAAPGPSCASAATQVFVMGLSMGGTLALRLAEEHGDEIAGLVLVNPSLLTKRPDRFLLPVLRLVMPSWPGIASDIKKPGVSRAGLRPHPAQGRLPARASCGCTTRADLGKVTQPLLVLRSHRGPRRRAGQRPAAAGEGRPRPTSARSLLEDSYHVATLDNDAPADLRGQSGVRPTAHPRPSAMSRGAPA